MGWFSSPEPQEQEPPPPVRLASPEFVSGLYEIAEIYERREKDSREHAIRLANELCRKGGSNFFARERLEHDLAELGDTISRANDMQALAWDVRDLIRRYEDQGLRPPYMPPLPPQPEKPYEGGE